MKIEDLAYRIAGETLELLEKKYHYRIPENHKREIEKAIREDMSGIISRLKKDS